MNRTPAGYRRFSVTITSKLHPRPRVVAVDARTPAEAVERVAIECERLDQAAQPRPVDRTFEVQPEQ